MLSRRRILKFTFIIMIATLLSKVMGLVREMYALHLYGAGPERDAFTSALRIPNAMRDLLAEGAFSAAFITIFSQVLVQDGEKKAFTFANNIINLSLIMTMLVVVISILLSGPIISIFHPGSPQTHELAVQLFQIIIPFLIFLSFASMMMGILNSTEHFTAPALAPFVSNVVFILVLIFSDKILKDTNIIFLAVAVLAGGLSQLLVQIPFAIKKGWRYRFTLDFKDPLVKQFILLFIPMAIAMGIPKLINLISNPFSTYYEGANTALYYSFIMIQLVLSVFVQGISVISLPELSKYWKMQDYKGYREMLSTGIKMTMIFAIPGAFLFMALSNDITLLLWRDLWQLLTGEVKKNLDNAYSKIAIGTLFFAPSLITMAVNVIAVRAYQSIQQLKIPIIAGIVAVTQHLIFVLIIWHVKGFGFTESTNIDLESTLKTTRLLAISFSLQSLTQSIILVALLIKKVKGLEWQPLLMGISKIIFSAGAMTGAVIIFSKYVPDFSFIQSEIYSHLLKTIVILIIAAAIYIGMLILLKDDDIKSVLRIFIRKIKK